MPILRIILWLKEFLYNGKQGKRCTKATAIRCYQCFSLGFLPAKANWLKKEEGDSHSSQLLTAPDPEKRSRPDKSLTLSFTNAHLCQGIAYFRQIEIWPNKANYEDLPKNSDPSVTFNKKQEHI